MYPFHRTCLTNPADGEASTASCFAPRVRWVGNEYCCAAVPLVLLFCVSWREVWAWLRLWGQPVGGKRLISFLRYFAHVTPSLTVLFTNVTPSPASPDPPPYHAVASQEVARLPTEHFIRPHPACLSVCLSVCGLPAEMNFSLLSRVHQQEGSGFTTRYGRRAYISYIRNIRSII